MKVKIALALFYGNAVCAAINFGLFAASLNPTHAVVGLFNAYAAWNLNRILNQTESK